MIPDDGLHIYILVVGADCPRCLGSGETFDDAFEYEWATCPLFALKLNLECQDGTIGYIEKTS